jgi:hypothetical protein
MKGREEREKKEGRTERKNDRKRERKSDSGGHSGALKDVILAILVSGELRPICQVSIPGEGEGEPWLSGLVILPPIGEDRDLVTHATTRNGTEEVLAKDGKLWLSRQNRKISAVS